MPKIHAKGDFRYDCYEECCIGRMVRDSSPITESTTCAGCGDPVEKGERFCDMCAGGSFRMSWREGIDY